MASSFEKSVKGATKVKLAAPKAKYVEHILLATHAGEAGIAEIFRALTNRIRDSAWTIVFKSLIVIHYMIREGEMEVTLRYIRKNPRIVSLQHVSDFQVQGRNLRNYSFYISERARAYGEVRTDFVRSGEGRLRKLSVEKGLLREVECVQAQIRALLKCTFLDDDVDNEITLLAFRLLVSDLLVLFHVVNEGMINLLEHYFEMSRYDAERALEVYKTFTKQTAEVVEFLQQARRVEPSTRLQIPNIKHAPTSLTASLEEYLHDPDFDNNRSQYLGQHGKSGSPKPAAKTTTQKSGPTPATNTTSTQAQQQTKIAPDLIDFFESIETEQTPMFGNPNEQQGAVPPVTGLAPNFQQQAVYGQPTSGPQQMPTQTGSFQMGYPQTNNPYPQPSQPQMPAQPVQTNYTGAGFGGYAPQDPGAMPPPTVPTIPQQYLQQQQSQPPQLFQSQPQQSFQPQAQQQFQPQPQPQLQIPSQTDTNPFRQSMMMTGATSNTTLSSYPASPPKSTNPFARSASTSQSSPPLPGTSPYNTSFSPQSASQSQLGRSPTVGTNPFSRNISPVNTMPPPTTTPTGSTGLSVPNGITNPFRQSMLASQQQQQQVAQMNGNYSGQTGTMGGLENLETTTVFPRTNPTGAPGW